MCGDIASAAANDGTELAERSTIRSPLSRFFSQTVKRESFTLQACTIVPYDFAPNRPSLERRLVEGETFNRARQVTDKLHTCVCWSGSL